MPPFRLAALLAFASLLAGCGAGEHAHGRFGTEVDAARAFTLRAPTITAVPQVYRVLEVVLVTPTAYIDREHASALAFGLRDALARTGAFDGVAVASAGAPARAEIRLELAPRRYELVEERSEHALSALLAYLFLGPWSNWWHDREFTLACEFDAVLRDTRSGKVLKKLPPLASARDERLSFWERRGGTGATIATICWVPPMLLATDEARVRGLLAPPTLDAPAATIVETIVHLRAREADAVYARVYPLAGLDVRVVGPVVGPEGVTLTHTVALELRGDEVKLIRAVWIGEKQVYDAARGRLSKFMAQAHELTVRGDPVKLTPGKRILALVQMGDERPVTVAEVGLAKTLVYGDP